MKFVQGDISGHMIRPSKGRKRRPRGMLRIDKAQTEKTERRIRAFRFMPQHDQSRDQDQPRPERPWGPNGVEFIGRHREIPRKPAGGHVVKEEKKQRATRCQPAIEYRRKDKHKRREPDEVLYADRGRE